MNLNPPTEYQLLVFWVALLVIVVAARLFGAIAQRVGQPAVVGELAAGLVIGPSILGRIAPGVTDWLFPADDVQTGMLFTVGWLGVLLLLVSTGFETDLGLIRRLGRAATFVSAGSLVIPAVAGFAVGWYIPSAFIGVDTERYIFAAFFAAALSISSLPVIAKILSEMGLMRRNFGQLTLAAGMANDVVGWIGLGFIAGLAQAGGVKLDKLAFTVIGVTAFFALAFTVGQRAVDASLRRVRSQGGNALAGMTVVLITSLSFGAVTQWLHVEAVLGAFIAGVVIARSRFADHELMRPLETMTAAFFAPVFFATAGLRIDLGLLADAETIVWALIVVAVASASKFIGSVIGARLSLLPLREGTALGVGLNARGALEIVIATVGLSLGVLNDRSYTVVVLMAMATSMAAPPLLRRVLSDWQGTPAERRRLDLEAQLASNSLVTGGRVLLPAAGGLPSLVAAQVTALAWPRETSVTLLSAQEPSELIPHRNVLAELDVDVAEVGELRAETIVAESKLGYDAVVMGVDPTDGTALPELVRSVLRHSPVPVVLVRAPVTAPHQLPWAFGRAVVPVNGAASARPAQELAAYLSANIGTRLHHLHVSPAAPNRIETLLADHAPHDDRARHILDDSAGLATVAGANHTSIVEHDTNPARQIVATASELDADLVVISGTSRTTGSALFFGHTIQQVLDAAVDPTVIVILMPGDRTPESVIDAEGSAPAPVA